MGLLNIDYMGVCQGLAVVPLYNKGGDVIGRYVLYVKTVFLLVF